MLRLEGRPLCSLQTCRTLGPALEFRSSSPPAQPEPGGGLGVPVPPPLCLGKLVGDWGWRWSCPLLAQGGWPARPGLPTADRPVGMAPSAHFRALPHEEGCEDSKVAEEQDSGPTLGSRSSARSLSVGYYFRLNASLGLGCKQASHLTAKNTEAREGWWLTWAPVALGTLNSFLSVSCPFQGQINNSPTYQP